MLWKQGQGWPGKPLGSQFTVLDCILLSIMVGTLTCIPQVYKEFLGQVKALTIPHLLDQFVRSKGTGKAIPGIMLYRLRISVI